MADKKLIERAEEAFYKTYNRFPVVFDHGEGYISMIIREINIWISAPVLQ